MENEITIPIICSMEIKIKNIESNQQKKKKYKKNIKYMDNEFFPLKFYKTIIKL